ncbi:MAG: biosynthetic-type acetolactate synthase large subunit [Clostridia bacterium]|nr:biosynthetic-type acetolactate synthase large subunit [Clostridia bacterium]
MNGAEYIVRELLASGTNTVFGYPGGTVVALYDALYKHRREIRHIRTAAEPGAVFAADGYARSTGRFGVCIATSGPGATNLVTGIANAFMDSVPLICITGNVDHHLIGTDSFQEVDIVGMTLGVTKHSWAVRSPELLTRAMQNAFRICTGGRPGPVLIDVAKDVLEGSSPLYDEALTVSGNSPVLEAPTAPRPDAAQICAAAALLADAQKPLIICGGGARRAGAGSALSELAERLCAPVCATLMGLGTLPAGHPNYLGLVGAMASPEATRAIKECDLILTVGARFSNRSAGSVDFVSNGKKLVQIDADSAEINKIIKSDAYIEADARAALEALNGRPERTTRTPWFSTEPQPGSTSGVDHAAHRRGYIAPADIFDAVKRAAGERVTVATDVGLHQLYTARYFPLDPEDLFLTSGGLGTMGYGLGAAIGAQLAMPERTTVLFTGDGSFLMNMNELATLAEQQLPVIIVVLKNGQLGMVHELQRTECGRRYSATVLKQNIKIPKLAAAFGLRGVRVHSAAELEAAVRDAAARKTAAIIEVRTYLKGC